MLFGMEILCVNLSSIIGKNESNQHKRQQSAFLRHQDFTSARFKKICFHKNEQNCKNAIDEPAENQYTVCSRFNESHAQFMILKKYCAIKMKILKEAGQPSRTAPEYQNETSFPLAQGRICRLQNASSRCSFPDCFHLYAFSCLCKPHGKQGACAFQVHCA